MNTERWEQAGELFEQALALTTGERAAFLDKACQGDDDMRREVESLLAGEESASAADFLDPNLLSQSSLSLPAQLTDPMIGQRLGNYEIKKRIGRGGMGNVYLATRTEDFKRRVAIKLLKRGMDTDEILRRFRMEIRVLAALGQHDNIAKLLDAGTTDDGLPYFVMEYVEGKRIDDYCDTHRLGVRERLALFQKVAEAVHFAHQHTIIHRDLKPSNVMVGQGGQVKLIDFGIAKLTAPELGGETAAPTATQQRAMTPEYASPEQLRGDSLTTATDVFSLGVLLYELLTGRRPQDVSDTQRSTEEPSTDFREFPRPSSVVLRDRTKKGGDTTTTAGNIAAARNTSPRGLRDQLRGDLDNMVGKSLRAEPKRRYASAGQLAADIERYLTGEPIVARPLSGAERLWRTCRRNPVGVSILAGVLAATLFGLAYLTHLSTSLVKRGALASAEQQANMLLHGHKYYTNVLDELKHASPEAAADLKPPATFTIELFEYLSKNKARSGTQARLLSRYPFRNRQDRPGLDDFENAALDTFDAGETTNYHEFRNDNGEPTLRYALAMKMQQSCVDCHNSHSDSMKKDWQVGQVRGMIEVIRPLSDDVERTRTGLRGALLWTGFFLVGVFGIALIILRRDV
ncbi:protein kinase [Aeoliella sp. ICT_H6.2]|uniref:Protein kinase n=1 Tax=Aeoliella straminimaris TaxID=2954799 RepID=A0A9X2FEA8_9BACT|nr:protein kinase [Aeoliella straminimaris]MCO6047567.1 protein kinase [Aeoliella straminimaris]